MTEDLSQADEIAGIVVQVLMGHCVAEQVRMQFDANQGGILVAHGTDATVRERSTFANEDLDRGNGWPRRIISGGRKN